MNRKIFITGISTEIGKTVVSSIFVETLKADYWKPIQSGNLDNSDSLFVQKLTSFNPDIHPSSYELTESLSPHAAAKIDNKTIILENIILPKTSNHLIIEGAGGLLVPLNNSDTVIDLIKPNYEIILVSKHYLGSINHTLLSVEALRSRNLTISGIIFNGNKCVETENIIKRRTNIRVIGRIENEEKINVNCIIKYTNLFKKNLL